MMVPRSRPVFEVLSRVVHELVAMGACQRAGGSSWPPPHCGRRGGLKTFKLSYLTLVFGNHFRPGYFVQTGRPVPGAGCARQPHRAIPNSSRSRRTGRSRCSPHNRYRQRIACRPDTLGRPGNPVPRRTARSVRCQRHRHFRPLRPSRRPRRCPQWQRSPPPRRCPQWQRSPPPRRCPQWQRNRPRRRCPRQRPSQLRRRCR